MTKELGPVRAVARSLRVDRWAAESSRALRAAGVGHVLIKGPAIAKWLYDRGEPRPYADVDMLVDPGQIDDAGAVLRTLGYSPVVAEADIPSYHERFRHAGEWVRVGDGSCIDLHRRLPGIEHHAWATVAANLDERDVGGEPVPVLPPPLQALVVALHARHHGRHVSQPLEDLRRAVARVDLCVWREAVSHADQLRVTLALAEGLSLTVEGPALAARLGLPEARVRSEEVGAGTRWAHDYVGVFDLLARTPGVCARVRLLREVAFPAPAWLLGHRHSYTRYELGLAYLRRTARLLREGGRALVSRRRA